MTDHDLVVRLLRDALGDTVLGAYLHGSSVHGGLRPDSDVDLLAVVEGSLAPGAREALVDGLLDISGRRARRGPARPVELAVVVRDDVVPWRYPPVCDLLYGEWLRDDVEGGAPLARETAPDLAVLLTGVLERGVPVIGPPPAELLEPVPSADLRRAVLDGVPGLLADLDGDERNVLLTLARVWVTLTTGSIVAKDDAADWVLTRLAPGRHGVVALARDAYRGEASDDWTPRAAELRACVDAILAEIERAARSGDYPAPRRS